MELAASDRHQSAGEWIEMIDPLQKAADTYNRPAVNASLGKTLTSLVTDTNRDLLTIPPDAEKLRPIDELTDKNVVFADWIKEFNEETAKETGGSADPNDDGFTIETPDGLSLDPAARHGGARKVDPAFLIDDGDETTKGKRARRAKAKGERRPLNLKLMMAVFALIGCLFAVGSAPEAFATLVAGITGDVANTG